MYMKNLGDKKSSLICVLMILHKYSDAEHPLTQQEIMTYLIKEYRLEVERRTVGRDIEALKHSGLEIISTKKGSYLNSRLFDNAEIRLLTDAVISSKFIEKSHARSLISKLQNLTSVNYKPIFDLIKILDQKDNVNNDRIFNNIDLVNIAIKKQRKLNFDFYKYGIDKKLYKSKNHTITPLHTVLHNQKYYVMAINEKYKSVAFYRLDHIKNMEILYDESATNITSISGYEKGINYRQLSINPYMYTDKPEQISFLAKECIMDQIVDWFGNNFTSYREPKGMIRCSLIASPKAMEAWAMQYLNYVEIVYPLSLREKIHENINKAIVKYQN